MLTGTLDRQCARGVFGASHGTRRHRSGAAWCLGVVLALAVKVKVQIAVPRSVPRPVAVRRELPRAPRLEATETSLGIAPSRQRKGKAQGQGQETEKGQRVPASQVVLSAKCADSSFAPHNGCTRTKRGQVL
eukprot:Amastigsp_a175842_25.p2 type:complete len:132 gc:universal Amastigsp_a175842_25:544-149(-)